MRKSDAVEMFGSDRALAMAIGISAPAVNQWGDVVPVGRRAAVRAAMQAKATELDKEAAKLRAKAGEE